MPNTPIQQNLNVILDELTTVLRGLDAAQCQAFADLIDAAPAFFFAGAGRSGLMARATAMRLMHMGRTTHVVGDTTTPGIRAGELLLVVSGSGSTGGMVAAGKKAIALGAKLAVVTTDASSPLAGMADAAVIVPAGGSRQPMANLFEQSTLLFLEAMVMELMRRGGMDSPRMFERHANLE